MEAERWQYHLNIYFDYLVMLLRPYYFYHFVLPVIERYKWTFTSVSQTLNMLESNSSIEYVGKQRAS